jgi:hypothetical protein
MSKVEEEARFDEKCVLKTNTDLSPEAAALKYKRTLPGRTYFQRPQSDP